MRRDLKLLVDAIDMHAHTHPALFNRPIDDADLASHAMDFGMRGFVLKDHDSDTTGRAYHVGRQFRRVKPFGAVVLNRSVGGLNPHVVQTALHYGARVVWMPSNHSKYHAEYFDMPDYPQLGRKRKQLPGDGVTVFDERGELKPEVATICELVAEDDACLATGHLSIEETRALQAEATQARGEEVPRHPRQLGADQVRARRPARADRQRRLPRVRGGLLRLADLLGAEARTSSPSGSASSAASA